MEHDQLEALIAAILTAGQLGRAQGENAASIPLFAKTLEELRASQVIVKKSVNFIPKGGR
jgi:hypothetical protein